MSWAAQGMATITFPPSQMRKTKLPRVQQGIAMLPTPSKLSSDQSKIKKTKWKKTSLEFSLKVLMKSLFLNKC